jgi:hypothetical protein
MDDITNSLASSLKERIRNPFLFTFLLVTIFKNWKLFVIIFNFEKDCNMYDKIFTIEDYLEKNVTIEAFIYNVLISFSILILTFILLATSKLIVDFYYKVILKLIIRLVDKKQIALKSDLISKNETIERISEENQLLKSKNVGLTENLSSFESKLDKQKVELSQTIENFKHLDGSLETFKEALESKSAELEIVKNEKNRLEEIYKQDINYIFQLFEENFSDDDNQNKEILQEMCNRVKTNFFMKKNKELDASKLPINERFKILTQYMNNTDLINLGKLAEGSTVFTNNFSSLFYEFALRYGLFDVSKSKIRLSSIGIKFFSYITNMNDSNLRLKK